MGAFAARVEATVSTFTANYEVSGFEPMYPRRLHSNLPPRYGRLSPLAAGA